MYEEYLGEFFLLIFTEIEQLHVKDLEAQKSRLDQEASTKLAELNNR